MLQTKFQKISVLQATVVEKLGMQAVHTTKNSNWALHTFIQILQCLKFAVSQYHAWEY